MKRWIPIVFSLLLMPFLACGGGETEPVEEGSAAPPAIAAESGKESPRLLSLPGSRTPATGQTEAAAEAPIHWHAPDHWVSEPPENSMRYAQYRVPASNGDASLIVFYFPPGQGGEPQPNFERWARQFAQPDGSDPVQKMNLQHSTDGTFPTWRGEITGQYDGGMAMMGDAEEGLNSWMLLGAIVETPDGRWFFKLTGPQGSIESVRTSFNELLASIHPQERS